MQTNSARLISLSFLVSMAFTAAASAGPVTGRVLDPSGRAIAHVGVLLVAGNAVVDRTVTEDDGTFRILTEDEGRYEVRVAVEGFRATPVLIDAQGGAQDLGAIRVQVSAFSESVVVSASQVDVPLSQASSSVTVITREQLAATQVETVADALRGVPGLTVVATGGRGAVTTVFPRGGESDYSLVLVDSAQANTFGGVFDFAHLPIANVDRIEVVRGPQSALFGSNAIGSVVRIITRRDSGTSVHGVLEGGTYGTTRLTAGGSAVRGPWHVNASAERSSSEGMNDRRSPAGDIISNDDYERRNAAVTGGWRDGRKSVEGQLDYSWNERGFPGPFGSNPVGAFDGIDTISRGTNDQWLAAVSGTWQAGRRVRTQAQLTNSRTSGRVTDRFGPSSSLSRRLTARVQSDVVVAPGLDASAGFEFQRERAESTFITDGAVGLPVRRNVLAYFGEARWNRASRVFLTAGVRADDIRRSPLAANPAGFVPRPAFGAESRLSVNPKVSAAWFLHQSARTFTKVRAAAGTGIRPADAFEIAFTNNPSLKPERSRSYEAGIDHALAGGRVLVEATAFHNDFDDLIVAVGSFLESSRYTTDNISNARARGLEIAGTARTALGAAVDLQIRVAYTRLDTKILAVDREPAAPPPFVVGDPLLRRPRHQASAEIVAAAGRVTAYLRGGARSRVLDVEPSLGTWGGLFDAPGYSVWNAGAAWRLAPAVEITGRVDNLFDRPYEEAFGFPALGRSAMIGVRVAARR